MHPFTYARPAALADVLALLQQDGSGAHLLAGGTDLVVELRNEAIRPALVIDLKRVAELAPSISETTGQLRISATTVLCLLYTSPSPRD